MRGKVGDNAEQGQAPAAPRRHTGDELQGQKVGAQNGIRSFLGEECVERSGLQSIKDRANALLNWTAGVAISATVEIAPQFRREPDEFEIPSANDLR